MGEHDVGPRIKQHLTGCLMKTCQQQLYFRSNEVAVDSDREQGGMEVSDVNSPGLKA